jgi:hypothetical protein
VGSVGGGDPFDWDFGGGVGGRGEDD